jgi:hypothetical protein
MIELRLSDCADQPKHLDQTKMRRLQPARGRRPSSRQAPYSTVVSERGRCGSGSSSQGDQSRTPQKGKPKKPHFNLRYTKSVKLFILYHKEDCGWGWKPINRRRVDLLPVLYRGGYKPEIEENREVAGINGYYYRLNNIMPALTPDGSGLRFVERGGRFWELTEPCKCRDRPGRGEERKKGGGKKATKARDKEDAEARPRGMVDRYPEEVVYYWDEFVKHFVPQARHAEVYARAKRYCKCRPHTSYSQPLHPSLQARTHSTREDILALASLFSPFSSVKITYTHAIEKEKDVANGLPRHQARSAPSREGKRACRSGRPTTRRKGYITRTRPTSGSKFQGSRSARPLRRCRS